MPSFSDAVSFASQAPISAARGVVSLNPNTITASYTFPTGFNGESVGPITIADGVTVTIPAGSDWVIR